MNKFIEFYNYVSENHDARAKLEALMGQRETMEKGAYFDAMIAFAKENGFEFQKEEVIKYFEENFSNSELSDADLDAVAGGKGSGASDFWEGFKGGFVSVAGSLGFCFLD